MDIGNWVDKYKPIRNHFQDNDETLEGFETYGKELDFVKEHSIHNIWTLIEEDEKRYVVSGFRLVNRLLYYVTENPWGTDIEITFS